MSDLLIHIHGFLSSHITPRVCQLRNYIALNNLDAEVISPLLPDTPQAAVDYLERLIEQERHRHRSITLVGHSLGGYFATYLASKHCLKTVLINPVVRGYEIMCEFFGECFNPHTNTHFQIGEQDIAYLIQIHLEKVPRPELIMIMQQLDDEITDPRSVLTYYSGCEQVITEGGRHEFSNFADFTGSIFAFLNR